MRLWCMVIVLFFLLHQGDDGKRCHQRELINSSFCQDNVVKHQGHNMQGWLISCWESIVSFFFVRDRIRLKRWLDNRWLKNLCLKTLNFFILYKKHYNENLCPLKQILTVTTNLGGRMGPGSRTNPLVPIWIRGLIHCEIGPFVTFSLISQMIIHGSVKFRGLVFMSVCNLVKIDRNVKRV